MRLTKTRIFVGLTAYFALFNIAVAFKDYSAPLSLIISFPFLLFIPGLLVTLILHIKAKGPWHFAYYAMAISLVFLMVLGLAVNTLLPLVGISESLQTRPLLLCLDMALVVLGLAAWLNMRPRFEKIILLGPALKRWPRYIVPLPIVALGAMGATSLNNGGTNGITIAMLLLLLADFFYVFIRAKSLRSGEIMWHVFCWGLALLLMTSLRGWYVTGHDVQREFYVFELTQSNWHWSIGNFNSPYNACLSITVLPTMLVSLINIGDAYVYKLLFQIIFAMVPVAVYMLARGMATRKLALLSVLYFLAFPTFFTDMPMLNRQEIAFVLFAGMMLLLNDKLNSHLNKRMLFLAFGGGIVLAHYSTTYSMLAIFGVAVVIRYLFERWWFYSMMLRAFRFIKRDVPGFIWPVARTKKSLLTIPIIITFAALTFVWNNNVTHTSRGFADTLKHSVETLRGEGEEVKSTDTRSSLFGGAAIDPDDAVRQYVADQEAVRAAGDESDYYDRSTYEKYEYHAATDQPLPLTTLGQKLAPHVDLYSINFQLRQSFAKVLQILVLVGLGVLFFSKKYRDVKFNTTTMSVAMAGIGFLTVLVLLPILSLDYGLLRAFQQMLIVLALPTVLGSLWLLGFLKEKLRLIVAALLAALFFVCSTGLVAEMTGGYLAQLHLHNQGLYYDGYYIHRGEVEAIEWLGARRQNTHTELQIGIEADRFAASKLLSLEGVNDAHNSVYPGIVLRDAYVYLGYTNVQKGAVYALHNNEGIIYTYPGEFLDNNKSLIYSNGQSKVYR